MLFTNLISLYLLSVTVAAVYCAVQARALNGSDYTKTALLLCFAICFYILGYAMELNSSTTSQIAFWNRIEYIGIPFVSALWLTTGLIYTGHFNRFKPALLAAIYIIPFLTLIFRLSNNLHHLYFTADTYVEFYGRLYFVKQGAPWAYVQFFHSVLMIFASMGLFIADSIKSEEKQAGKILFVITASLFAVAGLLLAQIKPFGLPIDYMALCLPITCVSVILAITRYDLLSTKSLAKSKVFDASRDGILLLNSQGRILDYNNSAKRLFEQLGISLDNRKPNELSGKQAGLQESLNKMEPSVVKLEIRGEYRYYGITTEMVDGHNSPRGWIKTIRDVTEIYTLNEELKEQAMTDELSVLSNRRAFINTGRKWISDFEESSGALYLVMMDLDHFKSVNDQYGHPTGDLVIHDFAQILKLHFDSKSLIARLGGEEFAVLLKGDSDGEVIQGLNILLKNAEDHLYDYFGKQFHVTVSIGMTKKHPGQTLESMLGNADRALYQSKGRGRNCITVL